MGRFFTLLIIFILSTIHTMAQENIIEHPIKKGESVYVISKKYDVSMDAIFELNPGSEDVIYAGRTLRVPKSNVSQATTVISDSLITNYRVKRGETKSGLAIRFGVSIAMLEQQNPHIIRMLQADHIIDVDKSIAEVKPTAKEGEHIVIKGETLWGIAREKGISVAQLTAANADRLSEFLQIGQTLIIPDKNAELPITGEYLVKRGDTKYFLAKRFNMTIAELEQKNPQIIPMLMAGHKLDIRKTIDNDAEEDIADIDINNTEIDTTVNNPLNSTEVVISQTDSISDIEDNRYNNYVIQPKETLFSLSKKAGMSIDEFTSLNPKLLTTVNAGDVIRMPRDTSEITVAETNETTTNDIDRSDLDTNEVTVSVSKTNKNTDLYSNLDTSTTNGLYFYTPFSSDELSSSELRDNMVNSNSDYVRFVDFFQGAQIAIDSAKALNLNFDITLIKDNNLKQQLNIESPYKKNAILVPFLNNSNNFPEITSEELLSIIDIESDLNSIENNIVYNSIPSKDFQKEKTLNYIANLDANIIVVTDLNESQNKGLILNIIPDAKFLKVDNAGFFEENTLQNALSKDRLNYVVLDSEKTIVFLNTTTSLMNQLADYDIQLVLIESSLIPKQNEVSKMRYRILKLIFPAVIHPEKKNFEADFETVYQNFYNVEPSKSAILGFNITLDILLRLSQNGTFENTINSKSEHPHVKFDYQKVGDRSYTNTSLYLMQYDSNEGMIVLKNR